MMTSTRSSFLLLLLLLVILPFSTSAAVDDDKCAASTSYVCPHLTELCNTTMYVSDCLEDCQGYRNTDPTNDVCFDRKLLSKDGNPEGSGIVWRDALGILVWFCAAGIATACGVGGGGIYVPLGILLLNFAPKPSSGLSQASIFGASLGGLLLNSRNLHPYTTKLVVVDATDQTVQVEMNSIPTATTSTSKPQSGKRQEATEYTRPLIDFDMALFLAPMEMAGAVLGVLIQKILPNWLYLTLAAIILGFTAFKTYRKFLETRQKEQEQRAAQEDLAGAANEPQHNKKQAAVAEEEEEEEGSQNTATKTEDSKEDHNELLRFQNLATGKSDSNELTCAEITKEEEEEQQPSTVVEVETGLNLPHSLVKEEEPKKELTKSDHPSNTRVDAEKLERLQYWLEQDQRQFPREKVFGLLVLWIGLILLTFFKGGKGVDSIVGITCASPWYGTLIAIQFVWTFGIAAFYGYKLLVATKDKQACGYPFHPQDVQWDLSKIRFYSFFTFVAGIVAGLIGIGGGMVLGPLMLVMGIHPRVSSATTATMIVLTSSSVAVLFVTAGLVPWEYALTFFCVCFVGACLGKTKIDGYVKRTGRASLLIFLLATIIALATVGCIVIVLTRLAAADWCFAGFNKFCSVTDEEDEEIICPANRMLLSFMEEPIH